MDVRLSMQHKLSQSLVMTPQLQMAIKLLALSRLELIDQVRAELSRAHADVDQARGEIKRSAADAEGLRNELAAVKAKADAAEQAHQEHRKEAAKEAQRCAEKVLAAAKERDELSKATADARESAARLAGQLEAIQAQNKALMETLRGKVGGNG